MRITNYLAAAAFVAVCFAGRANNNEDLILNNEYTLIENTNEESKAVDDFLSQVLHAKKAGTYLLGKNNAGMYVVIVYLNAGNQKGLYILYTRDFNRLEEQRFWGVEILAAMVRSSEVMGHYGKPVVDYISIKSGVVPEKQMPEKIKPRP